MQLPQSANKALPELRGNHRRTVAKSLIERHFFQPAIARERGNEGHMKYGILTNQTDASMTPVDFARTTEACGFESIFIGDHPMIPVRTDTPYVWTGGEVPEEYAHFPAQFVTLSMMAAVTTHLRLATGVCLVPEHHPIQLSQLVASLDFFSGGRVIFGVGAGWLAEASEIMGVDFKKRWPKTMECLRAMKEIWTEEKASFQGDYVSFPPILAWPKPIQKPYPPILLGAGGPNKNNLPALRRIAEMADGWFPLPGFTPEEIAGHLATLKALCVERGRNFDEMDITIPILAEQWLKDDDEAAVRALVSSHASVGVHRILLLLRTIPPGALGKEMLQKAARLCGLERHSPA